MSFSVVTCNAPPNVSNAHRVDAIKLFTVKSVVHYECTRGYKFQQETGKPMVTNKTLQCLATGRWDKDSEPGCSRKYWKDTFFLI